jgi:hypothetical protein
MRQEKRRHGPGAAGKNGATPGVVYLVLPLSPQLRLGHGSLLAQHNIVWLIRDMAPLEHSRNLLAVEYQKLEPLIPGCSEEEAFWKNRRLVQKM